MQTFVRQQNKTQIKLIEKKLIEQSSETFFIFPERLSLTIIFMGLLFMGKSQIEPKKRSTLETKNVSKNMVFFDLKHNNLSKFQKNFQLSLNFWVIQSF